MKFYLNDQQQRALVTIKEQEIKLTRKEYLLRFAENKQNNPYKDKMLHSTLYNNRGNDPRNYSK